MTSPKSSGQPKKLLKLKAPFAIRRVSGNSMLPTLKPGQLILVRQWFVRPKQGQIVVVRHNGLDKIKRIKELAGGKVYIVGDNSVQSTDSRSFGWITANQIKAVVLV